MNTLIKRWITTNKQSSAGFTLLEVLAVVVIAGILAALAAPSWLQYVSNQRAKAVRTDLEQTLRSAQQTATQERRNMTVAIKTSSDLPILIVDGQERQLAAGEVIRPNTIALDVAAYTAAGNKDDDDTQVLTFDYLGQASVKKGTTAQTLPYTITVNATNANRKQCAIVYTLLGSVKTAEAATCDDPSALTQ